MEIRAKHYRYESTSHEFWEVYDRPPSPSFPDEYWQFEACISRRLARAAIDTDGIDHPRNRIVTYFTPSLATRKVEFETDPEQGMAIYVGFPLSIWERLDQNTRRFELADLLLIGLEQSGLITSVLANAIRSLYALETGLIKHDSAPITSFGAISLPSNCISELTLPEWTTMADSRRSRVCEKVIDCLRGNGYGFKKWELQELSDFNQHLTIARFKDDLGLQFVLIPGGSFETGLSNSERGTLGIGELFDDAENAMAIPNGIDLTTCYQRRKAVIGPLIVAEEILLTDILGSLTVNNSNLMPFAVDDVRKKDRHPLNLGWVDTIQVLKKFNWSLPTPHELEWCARAASKSIFYWGDTRPFTPTLHVSENDIPQPDLLNLVESRWPYSSRMSFPEWNQFGVRRILSQRSWCLPSSFDGNNNWPLTTKGGAANTWPWQGADEWKYLLPCATERFSLDDEPLAALRPLLRLVH